MLRVVIDSDPGVDDAIAILTALASPELDVVAITAVAGNVPLAATAENACKMVSLSGRLEVPVYAGAPGPLVRDQVFGKYAHIGAFPDDLVPSTTVRPQPAHAVDVLIEAARPNDPITICAIGPLTNVALALVQSSAMAAGVRQIVMMGGAFAALGHRTPWAEYNVYADPHAAEIVLNAGVPVVMMPLDVTFQALATAAWITALRTNAGAPGAALANLLERFDRSDVARFGRPGGPIHDVLTIAWLLRPDLFRGRLAAVGVATSGQMMGATWADFYRKLDRPASTFVVEHVDEAGLLALVAERLGRYGAPL